ncbi:uncharacterized protein si:ch211-276i12.4 [Mugil cephalus]|uniref:uncharacterized protein si:ch211-276i12.4 n=1 Tax=Mugil cephalus TaxID=48193 RepID=UPI001FB6F216|nr:uncharacterized protein si:ch211-276i12.4 [Mugil cephalus]
MEKFFKPVHSPSAPDEMKPRRNQNHHHQHQGTQSHRYTKFDDSDRNTDESQGHHRHHRKNHYFPDSTHHDALYPHQFHHSEEDEILYNHHTPVTLSRASSSSLSSCSSSSSYSSWYTEPSTNDQFSLCRAEQPPHSLSCSNIADVRRGFRDDDGNEPIVFATVKHHKNGSVCSELNASPHQRRKNFSSLDRGHSRSDEALLQCTDSDIGGEHSRASRINYGPLYKTASLNRSLAFSEEDILLGVPKGPKRAVSSVQLPGKGILKNKEHPADIRKAKSMEVLSPRVSKGQNQSGQKTKGIIQPEIEQARANFVQGKLQFSAFLDEITKQVISPSALNVLGVNNSKTTEKTGIPAPTSPPVKPQLPPKKHREGPRGEMEQQPKQARKQEKGAHSGNRKHSDSSNPDKLISYTSRSHHGSPPPRHYTDSPSHNTHHGSGRKDRRPSPTGGSVSGDRYGRGGPHLMDGACTSPEPVQPKQRHHRKQQPATFHSQHPHTQHSPQEVHPCFGSNQGPNNSPISSALGAGPGPGSESSSTKSDSSRARDTASTTTSPSSEKSARHQSQHAGHPKKHGEMPCDADHLQALQEENADLHQNLLQTVVCIESLEAELHRTRDELILVKEKYKSLLQTHTDTKQANNLLGEHLHIASESLCSERKYLQNRVSQLSSELEDAHRTIAAMENINVPCLIKQLLEKHFDSAEAVRKFLTSSAPVGHPATCPQTADRSHPPKAEDWLTKSEAGPQRVTAFTPFMPTAGNESSLSGQQELIRSPLFSVADISTAIYKKMAASYAGYPQSQQQQQQQQQQQPSMSSNHADTPPDPQQPRVGGDGRGGKTVLKVSVLEQNDEDVNAMSAQQILDDFLQQLHTHKEAGGGKEQQSRQEWASGVEQADKAAD